MDKWLVILILTLITILGGFLRIYKISSNPVSLNPDEVSFSYNAYSILKTGRDEWGVFMPLTFRSVGDYKNPIPIYLLVPFIKLFGLNEFGVRFPFALVSTLTIPLLYLLILEITNNKIQALAGAFLMAINPWHIFYGRFISDQQLAMTELCLGLLFFLKMIKGGKYFAVLSALFFSLTFYTYYSERVFVPILLVFLAVIYRHQLRVNIKDSLLFGVYLGLLILPIVRGTLFGSDLARGSMVFIKNDVFYTRYVTLDHLNSGTQIFGVSLDEILGMIILMSQRYLHYFQSDFLFFTGLNMTQDGSLGLGVLNWFEIPLLIAGIVYFLNNNFNHKLLIIGWILFSFIPAALTNNEHNSGRTIMALPMALIFLSFGFVQLIAFGKQFKNIWKMILSFGYLIVFMIGSIQAVMIFGIHFPVDRGEFSMEGNKQAVLFAISHRSEYQELVFDPFRGVQTPNIYSLPSHYILFYSQYDPAKYQSEQLFKTRNYSFSNFSIRKIYWPDDRYKIGILLVGSPWSFPVKDLKPEEILQKIYLSNGDLALMVVTPRPDLYNK